MNLLQLSGFRDNEENGIKYINWETVNRERVRCHSYGEKSKQNQTGRLDAEEEGKQTRVSHPICGGASTLSARCEASLLVFPGKSGIPAFRHHQSNIGSSAMPSAEEKVLMLRCSGLTFCTVLLMRLFWVN